MKSLLALCMTLVLMSTILFVSFAKRPTPKPTVEIAQEETVESAEAEPVTSTAAQSGQTSQTYHGPLVPIDPVDDETNHLKGNDTPFFIYTTDSNGISRQMESPGSQHKVGVNSAVANNFPNVVSVLPSLLDFNNDRDLCLVNAGVIAKMQFRYWRVIVRSAVQNPNQTVTLKVTAGVGADRCGMCCDGGVDEVWIFNAGQLQLQSRTFAHGFMAVGPYSLQGDIEGSM
jgi:hypothetical protein